MGSGVVPGGDLCTQGHFGELRFGWGPGEQVGVGNGKAFTWEIILCTSGSTHTYLVRYYKKKLHSSGEIEDFVEVLYKKKAFQR